MKTPTSLFATSASCCLSAVLLAGCGGGSPAPAVVIGPAYVLTDISNGKDDGAVAINNAGQALVTSSGTNPLIVSYAASNASRAVRRRSSQTPLPTYSYLYDGAHFVELSGGIPYAINDGGTIARGNGIGPAVDSDFNYYVQIPSIGTMLSSNSVVVQPFALNNAKQVVGTSPLTDAQTASAPSAYHAFLYAGYTTTDLGTLGEPTPIAFLPGTSPNANLPGDHSNSVAFGINDAGQIVGVSGTSERDVNSGIVQHAFLYQDGKMTDLGTLGGANSVATSINNKGQAAGYSEAAPKPGTHAAVWQNGQVQDLGAPQGYNSYALGINDAGQVVGTSRLFSGETFAFQAFVYREGKMLDLNKQVTNINGWTLQAATGINSKGQIVGSGVYKGSYRAFLLTPK